MNIGHKDLIKKVKGDRVGKDQYYKLNSDKLKKLGWKPKISLDIGISRTQRWINENFKKLFS